MTEQAVTFLLLGLWLGLVVGLVIGYLVTSPLYRRREEDRPPFYRGRRLGG